MTLNQVISRIRSIALAHKQLRHFYYGTPTEFVTNHTTKYSAMFLEDAPGSIELLAKTANYGFRMWLLDMVHVSENTKANEVDVQSDMMEVAKDVLATMDFGQYQDWKISASNPVTVIRDAEGDVLAGVMVEITIGTIYEKDVCAVPTEDPLNFEDMKLTYDLAYIATGEEVAELSIPTLVGKKILHIIRENVPLHKVGSDPTTSEFTWNNTTITLGAEVTAGERFLILWRNY